MIPTPIRLKGHNLNCVTMAPLTVWLPSKLSKRPKELPFSSFHEAILIIALPTIKEKQSGNSVEA